jgi:hypothetical protein
MTIERTRDEPLFFNLFDLSLGTLRDVALTSGQEGAVVTVDRRSGARTELVRLDPGWAYRGDGDDATAELFVLEGEVVSAGQRARAGGYVLVGQGYGQSQLSSAKGATVIVLHNRDMPLFPPPHGSNYVLSSWREPWQQTAKPGIEAHGSFHKSLRRPDFSEPFHGGPGGLVRLSMLMPGYADGRQHVHHDCYEEMVLLRGDLLMPERGLMGPGTFLGNPQELWHAPVVSLGGALLLIHTDAPQGPWGFRPYPDGDALAEEYLDGTSWVGGASHTNWADMTSWHHWTERPQYAQWRSAAGSESWASEGGREQAAAFRQQRGLAAGNDDEQNSS